MKTLKRKLRLKAYKNILIEKYSFIKSYGVMSKVVKLIVN